MFSSIVLLICTVGVPLAGWIAKQVSGTKKLTRGQALAVGKKLAWQVVEGMKRTGRMPDMSHGSMELAAKDAFLGWAKGEGVKVSRDELDASVVAFRQLSMAAKALAK